MIREVLTTVRALLRDPQGRLAVGALAGVFATGTVFYRLVEGWAWIDALYFTVVTLTTVGYGDLTPSSPLSKVFTIVLILTGVGYILAFLDFVVKQTVRRRSDPRNGVR